MLVSGGGGRGGGGGGEALQSPTSGQLGPFSPPLLGSLVHAFDSLRTYPFKKTKRSRKRNSFKISNAFPATQISQNSGGCPLAYNCLHIRVINPPPPPPPATLRNPPTLTRPTALPFQTHQKELYAWIYRAFIYLGAETNPRSLNYNIGMNSNARPERNHSEIHLQAMLLGSLLWSPALLAGTAPRSRYGEGPGNRGAERHVVVSSTVGQQQLRCKTRWRMAVQFVCYGALVICWVSFAGCCV